MSDPKHGCGQGYHHAPVPADGDTTCPCGVRTRVHRPSDPQEDTPDE